MPFQPFEPTAAKLVLVEGKEEVLLVQEVVKHLQLSGVQTKDYEGKGNLPRFLKALVATSGFRDVSSLGVMRDADESAENAFRSAASAVRHAGLKAPSKSAGKGKGRPRVSILILPDGSRPGMLEDVCLESVEDQPAIACVDKLLNCVEKVGEPPPNNISKAKVYAYLATRREPGRRIGETAGHGTWPFDSPAFAPLRHFLQSL